MSKAPVPGQVKTRLAPQLGMDGAAQLYSELLEGTLGKLQELVGCDIELCCTPDTHHPFFQACRARFGVALTEQHGTDLGERMSIAITCALQHAEHVVLVGADCPGLLTTDIETALQQLKAGADVVLGPATDGGYYLVAVRANHPCLFESVSWGSAQVLAATQANICRQGRVARMLATRSDIDRPADYLAWQKIMADFPS
mgnify:FL=1